MEVSSVFNSVEDSRSFLAGLIFLAKADGVLDENEVNLFQSIALAVGIDTNFIEFCLESPQCPSLTFSNQVQKRVFIREAILLCYADKQYHEAEKTLLRAFASEIGVSEDIVLDLEAWAEEGVAWQDKGMQILQR